MTIEVSHKQIELSNPAQQLELAKIALAKIEGAEPGDDHSAQVLAKIVGIPSTKDLEGIQKATAVLMKLASKAFLGFMGDGSLSSFLVGKRIKLPVEDRGLIILATQISNLSGENNWPEAAIMLEASHNGTTFEDICNRKREGWKGLAPLLIRLLASSKEEKLAVTAQVEQDIADLQKIWGQNLETLLANKLNFEKEITNKIDRSIQNREPRMILEVQKNLDEMKQISTGSIKLAIVNAQERLSAMLEPRKDEIDKANLVFSKLGRALLTQKIKANIKLETEPESEDALINQLANAIIGLDDIDYHALANNNPKDIDQIKKRVIILKGLLALIKTPEDLFKISRARRLEVEKLRKVTTVGEVPFHDPMPNMVSKTLQFYLKSESFSRTEQKNAKKGEILAATYSIILESQLDLSKAKKDAQHILRGLKSDHPVLVDTTIGRENAVLKILGLSQPVLPAITIKITELAVSILTTLVESIPDNNLKTTLTTDFLHSIFYGEPLQKNNPDLLKNYQRLQDLIAIHLHPLTI